MQLQRGYATIDNAAHMWYTLHIYAKRGGNSMNYIIGQIIGVVASVIAVLIPIFKKKWQMLVNNIIVNFLLGLNLIFLDEIGSGIFLFAVAVLQAIINLIHTLRDEEAKLPEKLIFLVLFVGLGIYGLVTAPGYVPGLNGRNLLEVLPIIGAVLSMCFVFARKEQTARKFLLGCDSIWATYYAFIGSTAILGNIASITLCLIAMFAYRKKA